MIAVHPMVDGRILVVDGRLLLPFYFFGCILTSELSRFTRAYKAMTTRDATAIMFRSKLYNRSYSDLVDSVQDLTCLEGFLPTPPRTRHT